MSTQQRRAIPNYWSYADQYVLQDAMFGPWTPGRSVTPVPGVRLVGGLYGSERPDVVSVGHHPEQLVVRWDYGEKPLYAWTDITWLLDEQQCQWRYYIGTDTCGTHRAPNPAADFYGTSTTATRCRVHELLGERDGSEDNVRPVKEYLASAADGSLPSVSWLAPASNVSDHPGGPSTRRPRWPTSPDS